jgi:hypothetical protein
MLCPPQGGTPEGAARHSGEAGGADASALSPLHRGLGLSEVIDRHLRQNQQQQDLTREMLAEWVERVRPYYAAVEMDASDVPEQVETFGVHEWNAERFKVLGRIRNVSLRKTLEYGCAYYFTADVDNFIRPCTLKELVALSLPIVAPLLRSVDESSRYSNYHADIDGNGYFPGLSAVRLDSVASHYRCFRVACRPLHVPDQGGRDSGAGLRG